MQAHIDRLNEMEKQLSDALLPEQKHAKRGNSIYAEVHNSSLKILHILNWIKYEMRKSKNYYPSRHFMNIFRVTSNALYFFPIFHEFDYFEVSEGYDLLKEDLKKCFRENQSLVRTNANLRRELAHEREKAIFAVNPTVSGWEGQ